ncbi:major facilitator superfamily domain-containing protein [Talaromyces proteolyticus]|uniref:Major facilitator superfamily domain-containing protein n=1 Tax=Talaromyces proteolyticus TaxID=1131652 RepID=A0AAD4PZV4_9EURO|nr:major facilitator superfamily domain-containing protein [Talaromyces proteolyticus]KAH8696757.1 major facilitator superfamily domain-containing protein [Talaromyces proteolyticus]
MTSETTALLASNTQQQRKTRDWWECSTVFLVFLINFLLQGSLFIVLAPRMQIYESILCQYHAPGNIGEVVPMNGDRCKDLDVQAELAFILGMEEFLTVFLSVLTIPYSLLADQYGWSSILSLSLCGIVLEMIWPFFICLFAGRVSLYWVLFAVAFEAIGGGIMVSVTMLQLILSLLVSQESRTRVFLYLVGSSFIATAIGQAVSTLLMNTNVWLPACLGCGLTLLALALSLLLDRTMVRRAADYSTNVNYREPRLSPSLNSRPARELCLVPLRTLQQNPQAVAILIATFTFPLGENSMVNIILLYISKRYGLSIAEANFLVAFSSIAKLFTYLVGIPSLGYVLKKYRGVTSFGRDRIIVQVEGILLLIGALCISLAPTVTLTFFGIIVSSSGMAIITILRSLVTDLVQPQDITIVYCLMSMVMRIGSGIAGPIFAWGFGFGMRLGQKWTNLPFLLAAIVFMAGTIVLSSIPKTPRLRTDEEPGPQGTNGE